MILSTIHRLQPDQLHFTKSDAANQLIARDPMALLVGFVLDQQVTVVKAFAGPLALQERLGSIEPAILAAADLEPVFRQRPAIHRYPRVMAHRVHDLAVHVLDEYDGDASRVWNTPTDQSALRRNLLSLPGFGEMKVASLSAVLAQRYGVTLAEGLRPAHPTLADVDSPAGLAEYQATKKIHRKEWDAIRGAERARLQ
jgi:uncharacterized HhH-GPD family protein